jgi:hypothetical protein
MEIVCTNQHTKRLKTPETSVEYDDPIEFDEDGHANVRKEVGEALIESYPAIEAASEDDSTTAETTAGTTAGADGEVRSETPDDLAARINDAPYVTLQRVAGHLDSVQGNAGAVSIRHGLHDADAERVRAAFDAVAAEE